MSLFRTAVGVEYELAGKAAYEAHVRTRGESEPTPWADLVHSQRVAWCEAARAAREVQS